MQINHIVSFCDGLFTLSREHNVNTESSSILFPFATFPNGDEGYGFQMAGLHETEVPFLWLIYVKPKGDDFKNPTNKITKFKDGNLELIVDGAVVPIPEV